MLALLAVLSLQGPATRAEVLLAAGELPAARALAERLVAAHPQNPAAHMLLGRIWFAGPVVGRYAALASFRTAARLAPRDPEPRYREMEVGFYLGSDEGDGIARSAILEILALDPDYRDVWARLHRLYRGPAVLRAVERVLAAHGDHSVALERRAELAVALDQPARAESLLARAAALAPAGVAAALLGAEAAFLVDHLAVGYARYDSALTRADARGATAPWDTVWGQIWPIATPEEVASYETVPTHERRGFVARFWSARDPNLLTPENERLAEHYARWAEARRSYRLLHPLRMIYREAAGERATALHSAIRELADTSIPIAARAGLGAQGLVYLRHGKPDLQVACQPDPLRGIELPRCSSFLDAEGWLYRTPEDPLSVGFAGAGGEFLKPVSVRQVAAARRLLRTDRTSLPAPLAVRGWSAFFRGAAAGTTDVYHRAGAPAAAAVVWDSVGDPVARAAGAGLLALTLAPGEYRLGVDADSGGVLGRHRGALTVPRYGDQRLAVSSLVLAADSVPQGREATLAAMPADLVVPRGAPLALYAEVYGLAAGPEGRARYRARYTFEPLRSLPARLLGGGRAVTLEFDRDLPAASHLIERLVLEPGRVAPGRYRLSLAVTDPARDVKSETAALVVTLR
jgi:hypothetical protein